MDSRADGNVVYKVLDIEDQEKKKCAVLVMMMWGCAAEKLWWEVSVTITRVLVPAGFRIHCLACFIPCCAGIHHELQPGVVD